MGHYIVPALSATALSLRGCQIWHARQWFPGIRRKGTAALFVANSDDCEAAGAEGSIPGHQCVPFGQPVALPGRM
eukprot:scaffold39633_cov15-Tisochrysis_lutea.AAC.1